MKDVVSRVVTIMVFMVLLVSGCGAPAPQSTSPPWPPTPLPTQLPPTPTPTQEVIEPEYTNPAWGLSMWYPEDWVYEEGESQVTFATSEQVISREETETGALMVIRPSWMWGWSLERWFHDAVAAWAYDSYLDFEIGNPQPQTIGRQEGLVVPFEATALDEVQATGFVAGAGFEDWGYFIVGWALDESPRHEADLKAMLDTVQFTRGTRPTPTVLETSVPTYINTGAGLSMQYPADWVYEEYESAVVFATSEEQISGDTPQTGAALMVWWGAYWVGETYELDGQPAHFLVWSTILSILDSSEVNVEDFVDQQPRIIGGKDGVMGVVLIFEGTTGETALPVRFFVAGAEHEGYGYTFYGLAPLEEWPEQWAHFEQMLDNLRFTTPPRLTPTVTPTATPTVRSGPIATPQALAGTPVPRTEAAISPENADQVTQLARWGRTEGVLSLAFAPDGKSLASVSGGELELWRVSNGTVWQTLQGQTASVGPVAFSTDRQTVASVCSESTVRLWRVNDGELLQSIDVDPGGVFVASSVAFSPDLQVLASGSSGGPVQLRRMTDATLLHTFSGHSGTVTGLAFSPNGEILASVSSSGGVQLCRVSDGEPVRTLKVRDLGIPSEVVFSPDGHTLAVVGGYGTLQLWRVTDGALLRTLDAHPEWVNSVAFSPDGRTLASASSDNTVRLWRLSDGALLHTLRGHTDSVRSVVFSPDGTMLASGSLDGTIRVWGIPGR